MSCCCDTVRVRKGEVLRRRFDIIPADANDIIVVNSARWQLINATTRAVVEEGVCEQDNLHLWCLIPFVAAGGYELKCTVVIPPETIIQSAHIKVVH